MTEGSPVHPQRDPAATAAYIAALAAELSRLARSQQLDTLAYILDMAQQEAKSFSGGLPGEAGGSSG